MGRIHLLDEVTANGIAAGEVVERPSSVVKELIENSIDSGATTITVEIEGGGITLIRVTDDGCGMDEEDARMAFQIHATSKLTTLDDLFTLHSMGFRGEALASISAVSRVRLRTCRHGDDVGTQVSIEAGRFSDMSRYGGPAGTKIEVRDLFYNMPARYKFLKKDSAESQYVISLVERFSLIRPDISFRLISQGKEVLHTPGNNDKVSALYSIYGRNIVDSCIPLACDFGEITIEGFVGKPEIARGNRNEQTIFVNDRCIRSKTISAAIDEAYKTILMKGRYAFIILSIYLPSSLVDVNVHPQKSEVRFWNDSEVFRAVFHAIQNALLSTAHDVHADIESVFRPVTDQNRSNSLNETSPAEKNIQNTKDLIAVNESDDAKISLNPADASIINQSGPASNVSYPERTNVKPSYPQQLGISSSFDKSPSETPVTDSRMRDQSSSYRERFGFSVEDLLEARIVGSAFATYIMIEFGPSLILLDQHAAHEKILYEELVRIHSMKEQEPLARQSLLMPEIIRLSSSDISFLKEQEEKVTEAGFSFEWIGDKEIILREIPSVSVQYSPKDAFRYFLDALSSEQKVSDENVLLRLATAACKAAVKANDRLDDLEIRGLIEKLVTLENPYHCPHGRPIMIRMTKKDLEKEFKRIV
jgi:DNA mismatch repair protein MutL